MENTLNEALASATAFSIKSSEICRDGCSLKTEFIRAILAALRLASAFVGQFYGEKKTINVRDKQTNPSVRRKKKEMIFYWLFFTRQ